MKPQDPLPPEDAVWKLLGQSRKVDVRPNFVADVIREARQTPQDRGFWAKIRGWVADAFEVPGTVGRVAWMAAALTIAGVVTGVMLREAGPGSVAAPSVVAKTSTPVVKTGTVAADPLEHLLGTDWMLLTDSTQTPAASAPVTASTATKVDKLEALLAIENTSTLSDGELALLVSY